MNNKSNVSKIGRSVLALVASGLFLTSFAHAQTNYYFDPGLSGSAAGGSGTWDTGTTANWWDTSTDTTFPAGATGVANFNGVGGTVSVVGSVDPAAINFGASTATTVNAGAAGSIDLGAANNFNISNTDTSATINAPISFSGGTGTISINLFNSGSGSLVFGSTVTNTTSSPQFFQVVAQSGTSEFTGDITGANSGFDPNSGSPTNDNLVTGGGAKFLVDNGNFDRFETLGGTMVTNGAVTVSAANSFTSNSGTIGGGTADVSNYTGTIANFGGTQTWTSVAGGRVNVSGDLFAGGVGSGNNMVINGDGIVAFTKADGMDYAVQYNGGNGTAAGTEVAKGTLLLENTASNTSATGAGWNQNSNATSSVGANNLVQIDNNVTGTKANLGGFGYTLEQVVAVGGSSMLTPGDISAAGIITPGTLHLYNGLLASAGLTANFELTLNPSTSSSIAIATTAFNPQNGNVTNGAPAVALVLDGTVTLNLLGDIDTSKTYTLFSSTAGTAWDINNATFAFTGVPENYAAHAEYVADAGGIESLDVDFTLAPEPSTYALMLGGLGVLAFCLRRRTCAVENGRNSQSTRSYNFN